MLGAWSAASSHATPPNSTRLPNLKQGNPFGRPFQGQQWHALVSNLADLHILDKPLGMPLNTLNLYTNRLGSSILPPLPANNQRSTGNVSQIQPSSMDMASDEEASIFPALHPQTQMETDDEPHQPRPPQSHAIEVKILHPDGSQLSLSLSTGLTCLQLKGVIHAHMPKMHPSTYTLTFQDFVLDDGLLISDVGISHGGVIQLHLLN